MVDLDPIERPFRHHASDSVVGNWVGANFKIHYGSEKSRPIRDVRRCESLAPDFAHHRALVRQAQA